MNKFYCKFCDTYINKDNNTRNKHNASTTHLENVHTWSREIKDKFYNRQIQEDTEGYIKIPEYPNYKYHPLKHEVINNQDMIIKVNKPSKETTWILKTKDTRKTVKETEIINSLSEQLENHC